MRSRMFWLVAGLVVLVWGSGVAVRGLARDKRFFAPPEFLATPGPRWGGREVMAPIVDRLVALGEINLFDPAFEGRIRRALGEVPGVAGVADIRRLWPNRYTVSCVLHRPIAVVHNDKRSFPVTAKGVVLPLTPYLRATKRLLVIKGLDAESLPELGREWDHDRLADALETVRQITPHLPRFAALGIHTVDVSESDNPRRGVVLRGADDILIRWGRPRADVGENSVARKVSYLALAASRIEQVRGFEIDVRWGTLFLRERSES